MKSTSKFSIAGLFVLALFGTTFFGIKHIQHRKQLKNQNAVILQLEAQLAAQKTLLETDSLLVQGKYHDALAEYENRSGEMIQDGQFGVGLRMAIAKKLLEFEHLQDRQQALAEAMVDSIPEIEEEVLSPSKLDKMDSLNFVLSKTKMQLTKLRKQLHKKSFGEYLAFTNGKGSQVHYVGQVKEGMANGYGVAILNTGSRYVGEWKNNERHGQGTFYWKDGEYYEGSYLNDKRNGQGTYYWPNGEKYVGQWKDDRRSGKGAFFGKDGKLMTKGVWEDDKMITSQARSRKQRSKNKDVAAL